MKFFRLLVIFVFIFNLSFTTLKANPLLSLNIEEWYKPSNLGGRIQKIIFVPIKKSSLFSISNEKFSQEIAYYFYRLGFANSPIGYALFEDNYIEINPNINRTLIENNLNQNIFAIALVYKDKFDINNFKEVLSTFSGNELRSIISNSSIKNQNDLEIRNLSVKNLNNKNTLEFAEKKPEISSLQKMISVDFNSKVINNINIESITIPDSVNPNELFDVNIIVKNNSAFDLSFDKSFQLILNFETDSNLFVTDIWANTRTLISLQDSFIQNKNTKIFKTKFKSPILPGKNQSSINLYLNNDKFDKKTFSFTVKDIGQKILKVRNYLLGVSIRKESTSSSTEINKVGENTMYIYTDEKNGFLKITLPDGKEGWISKNYVDIVK